MKKKFKLTLDNQATYQIRVPGEIIQFQSSHENLSIEVQKDSSTGFTITVFTCKFDQAGLHGFLKKLYSMGLPLVSVRCIECKQ